MCPLGNVISRHGISYHCYTDDILQGQPSPLYQSHITISFICPDHLSRGNKIMDESDLPSAEQHQNRSHFNCHPHQVKACPITSISFLSSALSSIVTNLVVKIYPQLIFEQHIKDWWQKPSFLRLQHIQNSAAGSS